MGLRVLACIGQRLLRDAKETGLYGGCDGARRARDAHAPHHVRGFAEAIELLLQRRGQIAPFQRRGRQVPDRAPGLLQ